MFLSNNSTYPIGLDISDLSLKLVQLNKIRDRIIIQAIGKYNLAKGIIENGEIKKRAELVKAVRKIMSSPIYGKVSSEEVIACLPESKSFIKLIEIQKSPNSLADIIGSEIEKHIPLLLNEIYFDWQIIEELADKYIVLIGAAPKDIVDQYTEMLDEAKLSPIALEIEPVAICRCLLKEEAPNLKPLAFKNKAKTEENSSYGIIDIGANHTCMIFYSGKTMLFTVSMPISGEEITHKIARALNFTKLQAEKAKIVCGLDNSKANGIVSEILAETIKNLVEKIKEAMVFYENYFNHYGPLKQILLCGGGANMTNLEKIISQELSVEVKLADALINLNEIKNKFNNIFTKKQSINITMAEPDHEAKEKNLSIKQDSSAAFTTAFGLALRGIFIDEL